MDMIADLLLVAGALGVAFYCFVLSRRLTRFTDLERGVGGAVAVLSAQVDDLNKALKRAQAAAEGSGATLKELTAEADAVARRLELHVAAMHDLPQVQPNGAAAAGAEADPQPHFTSERVQAAASATSPHASASEVAARADVAPKVGVAVDGAPSSAPGAEAQVPLETEAAQAPPIESLMAGMARFSSVNARRAPAKTDVPAADRAAPPAERPASGAPGLQSFFTSHRATAGSA